MVVRGIRGWMGLRYSRLGLGRRGIRGWLVGFVVVDVVFAALTYDFTGFRSLRNSWG